jgi:putative endonuclease
VRGDGRAVGALGERLAARFLRRAGYRVLGRNARVMGGEIDLLMLAPDRRTVVVVEVKTRVGDEGPPAEANVTGAKRAQLRKLARAVAAEPRVRGRAVRIDVVAVTLALGGAGRSGSFGRWFSRTEAEIRHFVGAVEGEALGDGRRGR